MTRQDWSDGFHPSMLVEWESRAYVHYVSRQNPNQPGSQWQFHTNVVLHHEKLGMVVLDILKDNRLGGIEFVDRIKV
jgi:hypothetical protein